MTAYALADGHKLWSVAAPGSGAVPCAMSATANADGVGAVLFQPKPGTGQACTQLVAVDTATGKAKWTKSISGATKNYGGQVMVDDTRVVAVGDSAAYGYDAATGKQSWSYTGPGKYCALSGNGTGTTVLLQSTCADTSPKQQAITLDAASGKLRWWRGLPQNAASYTVLSATPPVVAVHMSDPAKDTLMSFTDKGDVQSTVPVAQTGGRLDSTHGTFDPAPALFFQGTTLVAAVEPSTSAAGTAGATAFVALNLTNGQQLWRTAVQEKGQSVPVAVDDTAAVVATEERLGQPARLSRLDLTTGKETVGGQFPQNTGSLLGSGRLLLRDRVVVALPEYTTSYHTAATLWTGQ
ncbi:PQQ-binding-like beta-propeller repeat protein [Streptacidiphilus monticola]